MSNERFILLKRLEKGALMVTYNHHILQYKM